MKPSRNIVTTALALVALAACSADTPDGAAQGAAENEMFTAMNTLVEVHNTQEVDKLDAVMAANFIRRAPDQNANSRAAYKKFIGQIHAAYPDINITIDGMAVGPGGGFIKWTVTATNTGEGAASPTGNAIKITGISNYQFMDGKLVSEYVAFDTAALLSQLEASEIPHVAE